jgi:argininosuccinate synthase
MMKIVLAYSATPGRPGGIDAAAVIPWLAAQHGAEVIAVTVDLGQRKEWLEELRDRALAAGALRAHVVDVREEFARDYLVRGLKAGLVHVDGASAAGALARPLVAQTLVSIATIEQATAIAHGSRAGADAPFARAVRASDPALTLLAVPATVAQPSPGTEGTSTTAASGAPYAGIEHVDRSAPPRPAAGTLPDEPAAVDITIERGVPAAINGVAMSLLDLIGSLEIIAGVHGVAVPPLVLLDVAHHALESETLPREAQQFGAQVAGQYQRMLQDGSWFMPMRHALDAYVDRIQERVAGVVRLRLLKGDCSVVDCQPGARPAPTIIPIAKA